MMKPLCWYKVSGVNKQFYKNHIRVFYNDILARHYFGKMGQKHATLLIFDKPKKYKNKMIDNFSISYLRNFEPIQKRLDSLFYKGKTVKRADIRYDDIKNDAIFHSIRTVVKDAKKRTMKITHRIFDFKTGKQVSKKTKNLNFNNNKRLVDFAG